MMIMSAVNSTFFTLNEVATVIWQAADGRTPLSAIVASKICLEFDVDPDQAERDVEQFVNDLSQHGILLVSEQAHQIRRPRRRTAAMSLLAEMNQKALALGIPISVHLDITYRCNERCVHCYLDHDDHGEMTTAEIKDILNQLSDAGVFFLTLSGGEVLMRRDFFEIVEHARRLLFNVKVKTNGVMIREPEAKRIRELGVEQVQISVYSHRPEIHDAITKLPGSLKRTIEAIRFLKSQGLKVVIANVLMASNLFDNAGVMALAKELGVLYTLDPTITPKNGRRHIYPRAAHSRQRPQAGLPQPGIGGQRGRILRPAASARRRHHGRLPLQRRPHRMLHYALRRRLSLRSVSASQRQPPPAEVRRHLAQLCAVEGSTLDSRPRSSDLFDMRPRGNLYPLSRFGVHGRATCVAHPPPTVKSPFKGRARLQRTCSRVSEQILPLR